MEKVVPEAEEPQKAIVRRVVKDKLSHCSDDADININKDALLAFSESARIFIHYLSATANDICKESKRQTMNADDVVNALEEIEFPEFVSPLKASLKEFKLKNAGKKAGTTQTKEVKSKRKVEEESSKKGTMSHDLSAHGEGSDESSILLPALASLTVHMEETKQFMARMMLQWEKQEQTNKLLLNQLNSWKMKDDPPPPPPRQPATHFHQRTRPNDPASVDYYGLPRASDNAEGVMALSEHGEEDEVYGDASRQEPSFALGRGRGSPSHRGRNLGPSPDLRQLRIATPTSHVPHLDVPLHRANTYVPPPRIPEDESVHERFRPHHQPPYYERAHGARQFDVDEPYEARGKRHPNEERFDNNFSSINLSMPPFEGKEDPDAYYDWESKVDRLFACCNYSEEMKVKLAIVEFVGMAIHWWDKLVLTRRLERIPPVASWQELKYEMRRRFVPSYYIRDLHQKLLRLTQGTRSVSEYFHEMQICLMRANVNESVEATMTRFLGGLHKKIAYQLDLQTYNTLDDMLHLALKIERHTKPHSASIPKPTPNTNLNPRTPSRNIECFKCGGRGHMRAECPNRRVIMMREGGEIFSEDDEDVSREEVKWC